ncbi:hypothetical protein GCM10017673_52220 [Streptosporangium violaceochromogenes]|nr:hypothetical protein GCM10017673_52220 [Streptosporangium violaceochromogenes]
MYGLRTGADPAGLAVSSAGFSPTSGVAAGGADDSAAVQATPNRAEAVTVPIRARRRGIYAFMGFMGI